MGTIRSRLVERLDAKITRLKRAREKLQSKNLEDKKLNHQINTLVSMRNSLRKKDATEDQGIDSTEPVPPKAP